MQPITSGTCGITRAGWERQPALWSRGLLTTIGKAQIGVGSLGGFTTTFLTVISSSILSSVPSTFSGLKIRRDGSTVSSSRKVVSQDRRILIMAAVIRTGMKDFRH